MPTTTTTRQRQFISHACLRCAGDAFWDALEDEWRCLQCGRTVAAPSPTPIDFPERPSRRAA